MNEFDLKNDQQQIGSPLRSSGFLDFIIPIVILVLGAQIIRYASLHFSWGTFLNDKFAFSINIPTNVIFILYFAVVSLICYYFFKHKDHFNLISKLGFIFVLAGGFSNLIERVLYAHVVDYIFILNGVLNLADVYIFLGLIFIIFLSRINSAKL